MDKEQQLEADEQYVPTTPSPGQVLREAREKQGLSQQAIADKLFLKVKIISDLEENRLDENTSLTFIKGYVRLYAKNIGLNSEELIGLFEQYHIAVKPPAKLQSFSKRVATQAHDDRWMMVTYVILLILIAGVVVWWYQQPANEGDYSAVSTPQSTRQLDVDAASDSTNVQATLSTSAQKITTSVTPDETDTVDIRIDDENLNQQDNTATAPAPNHAASITDQAILPSIEPVTEPDVLVSLVFTFADDCWVNVTDSTGEALAFGIKVKGYEMAIEGIPPFEITLGAPHVVQIDYNGEAVDMSGFDPTRTAKFFLPMQEQ